MKRIRLRHLVIAGCATTILATLFIRSYVYEVTEPHRQPASFPSPLAETSNSETITVHFHDRRPFYMRSADEVHGLVADPIATAFEHADIPFKWQETPAKRQLDIIARNEDKSCAAGWFKTPERETFAIYTLPVYQDKPFVAVARADNEYLAETEILDRVLQERRLELLVKEGYSYGEYVDGRLKTLAPRQVKTTADNRNILKMIESYRADYSFMTEEEAYDLLIFSGVKRTSFKLVHFSDMPPGNKRHIICSRQVDPEIIARLDSAIRFLQRSEGDR
jgi:uncharacterized protein (TIGR02285 family)